MQRTEFHINKENYDEVINRIPFGMGASIIFDDEESFNKFSQVEVECEEKLRNLVVTEVYMKCFHNGYKCTFNDCAVSAEIEIPNPNFGKDDPFKGTTLSFGAINCDEKGEIDITKLVYRAIIEMQQNPNIRVKITGWMRQLHFDKNLLSIEVPQEVLKYFSQKEEENAENP